MSRHSWPHLSLALAFGIFVQLGCAEVLGLQDRPVDDSPGDACEPGATQQCNYSGPAGTNGVGACRAAERTCRTDGTGWDPCQGEVTPKPEACDTVADDDCDGVANEADAGCACVPGEVEACYSGPAGTADVGMCKTGSRVCSSDGLGFGPCTGEVLPAVEDCKVKGDEDCSGLPCSDTLWSSVHGDEADQHPRDVAIDGDGNVFVVGSFSGSLKFGDTTLISSGSDVFLAKFAPDGQPLWAKRFGNSTFQSAEEMAVDKDGNVILTGGFETTIDLGGGPIAGDPNGATSWFVAKLGSNGDHIWSKPLLASSYLYLPDVATGPDGDVVLTGSYSGTVDFGGASTTSVSGSDAFVVKLAGSDGTALWAQSYGASGSQRGLQTALDVSGNIALVGSFGGTITFDLDTYTAPAGEYRLFIARLDPDGVPFFSMEITGELVLPSLAVDPAGNILLAAAFQGAADFGSGPLSANGPFDIALARVNLAGDTTLIKQIGGPSLVNAGEADEFLALVGTDAKGDITLVTRGIGTVDYGGGTLGADGATNIFVGKLSPDGVHLWSKQLGPLDLLGGCFPDTAQDGTLVLGCGESVPSLDMGNGALTGNGGLDVFVAKLAP